MATIQDIERVIGNLYLQLHLTGEQLQQQAIRVAALEQELEALRAEKEEAGGEGDTAEERG